MRKRLKVVSFDFDSTLSNSTGRQHLIDRSEGHPGPDFWNTYSMLSADDTDGPALPLAQYFTATNTPWIVVSGRSECARDISREWLRHRKCNPWGLYLCDERHDTMDHGAWKAMRLLEIQEQLKCEIVLHIDDITAVAVHTEKVGIPTLLVHRIDSEFIDKLG